MKEKHGSFDSSHSNYVQSKPRLQKYLLYAMKWGGFPGTSSVHRYTCLALYRALLRQCSKLPATISQHDTTREVIRRQFDKYKTLNSPTKSMHSLEAGYEALDMMHSASQGDSSSMHHIRKLLEGVETRESREIQKHPNKVPVPTSLSPRQKKRVENIAFQRQSMFRHPDTEPILSRPRPIVAGRRRIPALVNARGVPFLRIKKPQPQCLSRALRQKHAHKDKITKRRHRLDVNLLFAGDEEDWDRIIAGRKKTNITNHESWNKGSWTQSAWESQQKADHDGRIFQEKQQKLAEAMWKVVLAERRLAEKEEAERKTREFPP